MDMFISYGSEIEGYVGRVCHALQRQSGITCFFAPESIRAGSFPPQIINALKKCDYFTLFLTPKTAGSQWQMFEIKEWIKRNDWQEKTVIVNMDKVQLQLPSAFPNNIDFERIIVEDFDKFDSARCSDEILGLLSLPRGVFDDIPTEIDASYEKDIINLYERSKGVLPIEELIKGYPEKWPEVNKINFLTTWPNPLDEEIFGKHRKPLSAINVDARARTGATQPLTLPEAGPQERILPIPAVMNKVLIIVSGGIAPGINAVISAICDRHRTYVNQYNVNHPVKLDVEILGGLEGFRCLLPGGQTIQINDLTIKSLVNRGGSYLPTSRVDDLLEAAERSTCLNAMAVNLHANLIKNVYIIGGEGSMRAAHGLWTVYHRMYPNDQLSVVGIPKTMDNDILWVWQSFGFISAIERARQNLIEFSTEIESNPRIGIMQLFGSSSGFVVSHAALGSNVCDLALIPELEFTMQDVCNYMGEILSGRLKKHHFPYGLIAMAETAIPIDFRKYMNESYVGLNSNEIKELLLYEKNKRRVLGQTPDHLRRAGLKIVHRVLQQFVKKAMGEGNPIKVDDIELGFPAPDPYWKNLRVITNEPRHLIRSMPPTVEDVAKGIRLGTMAVDMAMAGYSDCMVSQWLTEYVTVPLELVILGRKQVPLDGVFWKTVVSKTGQLRYNSLAKKK
jgi:6-phosphofructokinase 1